MTLAQARVQWGRGRHAADGMHMPLRFSVFVHRRLPGTHHVVITGSHETLTYV